MPEYAQVRVAGQSGTLVNGNTIHTAPVIHQTVDRWGNVLEITDSRNPGWKTSYRYNAANQITEIRQLDGAGLLTHIDDAALGQVTEYRYDMAGNRLREKTTQQGQVLQDNHLGYDAQGRLVSIDDARYSIRYEYDANGNRTHAHTRYRDDSDQLRDIHSWSTYDEMNRQTIVDGVRDANGNVGINDKQGHRIAYDKSGNRISDVSYGKKIAGNGNTFSVTEGQITERYDYDAAGRLTDVWRDDIDLKGDGKGLNIDARRYDAAGRMVYGGMTGYAAVQENVDRNNRLSGALRAIGLNTENRAYLYQNGLLKQQSGRDFNYSHTSDLAYQHDNADNLDQYLLTAHGKYGTQTEYDYHYDSQDQRDGYQVSRITARNLNNGRTGATTNSYDVNGNLVRVDDATRDENDRTLYNDAAGRVLLKVQGTERTHTLIVNGEVLGSSGSHGAEDTFGASHVPVTASSLSAPPGSYTVRAGETLQGIAKAVWGDGSLWYLIAEANGLSGNITVGGDGSELADGQVITLPSRTTTLHNDFQTFKPYSASEAVGDMTPNLPVPGNDGGCGGAGTIIAAIIVIVVAVVTQQYYLVNYGTAATASTTSGAVFAGEAAATAVAAGTATATSFTAGSMIAGGAIGGAVGSVAGQIAGNALGVQDGFSWRQVALGAIAGGVAGGLSNGAPLGGGRMDFGNVVIRGAMGNALTQGIGVATGLQDSFSWRSVAASAVGAGMGQSVTQGLQGPAFADAFGKFGVGMVSGFAAGAATAVLRGGRISVQQVATDAFGNALGNSLAYDDWGGSQQTAELNNAFAGSGVADSRIDSHALELARLDGQAAAELALRGALDRVPARPISMQNVAPSLIDASLDTGAVAYRVDLSYPQRRELYGNELGPTIVGGAVQWPVGSDGWKLQQERAVALQRPLFVDDLLGPGMFKGAMAGAGAVYGTMKNVGSKEIGVLLREGSEIGANTGAIGLDWTRISARTGGDAAEHITLNHGTLSLTKPNQGVFYGNSVSTVEDAWAVAQKSGVKPVTAGNRDIYVVPRPNSGFAGGMGGQLENYNHVTIIMEAGTNRVVTGYPSGGTPPLPKGYNFLFGNQ